MFERQLATKQKETTWFYLENKTVLLNSELRTIKGTLCGTFTLCPRSHCSNATEMPRQALAQLNTGSVQVLVQDGNDLGNEIDQLEQIEQEIRATRKLAVVFFATLMLMCILILVTFVGMQEQLSDVQTQLSDFINTTNESLDKLRSVCSLTNATNQQ